MNARTRLLSATIDTLEDRSVPAILTAIPDNAVVIAPDEGGMPIVRIVDPTTGEVQHFAVQGVETRPILRPTP